MLRMSVTDDTSQSEMSPLKDEALWNMKPVLVTRERSGVSVALYTMFDAPQNASHIDVHWAVPHWSMDTSLFATARLARWNLVMPSDMLTV